MREFVGKAAFVTGGASGIGLALGRAFADAGCKVMLADIERTALDARLASFSGSGREIRGIVCDVADTASVDAAAEATFSAFGNVHILCNNAGVGARERSPIMAREISAVLEYGAPEPGETATMIEDKLRFHTDSWDLSVDLRAGLSDIVVIDARSRDSYAAGHIPGAVSFPHREMSARTTAQLDRSKVYVVYCDGIGCNASTKGAYKLAGLGFRAKELLGGIDWWRRDGHPVAASHEPGSLLAAE